MNILIFGYSNSSQLEASVLTQPSGYPKLKGVWGAPVTINSSIEIMALQLWLNHLPPQHWRLLSCFALFNENFTTGYASIIKHRLRDRLLTVLSVGRLHVDCIQKYCWLWNTRSTIRFYCDNGYWLGIHLCQSLWLKNNIKKTQTESIYIYTKFATINLTLSMCLYFI